MLPPNVMNIAAHDAIGCGAQLYVNYPALSVTTTTTNNNNTTSLHCKQEVYKIGPGYIMQCNLV
jgi:hypothetical protein